MRTAAYERAAIVWAWRAATGHEDGISIGTTPRRYDSSGSSLTTSAFAPERMIRRVPR